ncbi:hypothetical protein SAMD00019534_036820 [Acytostelium subglobosum LB1]|uniref:hypothetical protein n=1 Tax=Acytostelium subglobosum LB1 TaxID=1410327 RepID=UPI000644D2EF|nr:hypothetical protein SAMD00019534_036820 [Acytostelium subglobosum LB1]GAM20507.1 hypothetical protein SAMD00019534_036820 [Acytostelium subglobosum LB1]|eukprot:XP_012760028.1 hypothetical protein SAMD00019534_036820 [Acytostelium subglobosum LB1]
MPQLEGTSKPEHIVESMLQTNTVGIINQITALAEHANNIFASLANETALITGRLNRLNERLAPLTQSLPLVEAYHQRTPIDTMNNRARVEYHSDPAEKCQLFTTSSMPDTVTMLYNEKCRPPPNLSQLDTYQEDGTRCLKLYTNPDFFVDEWVAEMKKKNEEARERKRLRKEERLRRRGAKGEAPEVKSVKRVQKVRYDPETGAKITVTVDVPINSRSGSSPIVQSSNSAGGASGNYLPSHNNSASYSMPPPPPQAGASSSTPGHTTPPPPIMNAPAMPSTRPQSTSYNYPPPPPSNNSYSNMGYQTPPPQQQVPQSRQSTYNIPPPISNNNRMAPPPPSSTPAPPPPPPPSAPAPPPPPPPPPMMGGGGGLASALEAGGSSLRPAETKPKTVDTRSNLLSAIVSGMNLRPADERKVPEKPVVEARSEPINVADILARRIAWAHSDSEDDDDSDDDSEWD